MNNNTDKIGINFRSLLDGELAMFTGDFSNYNERNEFITEIEKRLINNDWISLYNGITFEQSPASYFLSHE
jgi:hypothetical protein